VNRRRSEVEAYLRTLASPLIPHGWLELRIRRGAGGMRQQFYPSASIELAARAILPHGQRTDVYVGVAPRSERSGSKSAIRGSWVLWAECDDPMAGARLLAFDPPPTLTVASGTPGHVHAYWALRELASCAVVEHANRRLAHALGADRGSFDVSRVLRPPNTLSHKHMPPQPVELLQFTETRRYSPGEVAGLLPDPPTRRAEQEGSPTHRPGASNGSPFLPDWLRSIAPVIYVAELAGLHPDAEGKVSCPFHHEEHPSLHLYPDDWYCFGCRRGGSIVDFAGFLWNLHTRGGEVIEIRERLIERFSELRVAGALAR
jgi:hypothetical protein